MTCQCGCGQPTPIAKTTRTEHGWVKGQPIRFVHGHHTRVMKRSRLATVTDYRKVTIGVKKAQRLHRFRAEQALGKPLPPKAIVHHADGSRADNAPLVICQDAAYHKLLHMRMRIKAAGGDPNTDKICSACKRAKDRSQFWVNPKAPLGVNSCCKDCMSKQNRRVA
jgi:hypothetical protein